MFSQLRSDRANTPSKVDGPLHTASIVTIGSAPHSHHEFRLRHTALCSLPSWPLTQSHLPGPCWFPELPLTVSWKLIPRLNDSVRSSDLCQKEKKEACFQQGVSTPLLARVCSPALYYAVRVRTGLSKPIHHCSGKSMLWRGSLDGVSPLLPTPAIWKAEP